MNQSGKKEDNGYFILKNGYILTMNDKREILEDGTIVIEGDEIKDIGPTSSIMKKYNSKNIKDLGGAIVHPGLVDAHEHTSMHLIRSWLLDNFSEQEMFEIFEKPYNPKYMKDAVECKLFGIGSESFVVGSHEFYLGYALTSGKMLCIDLGHFHPTESVSDKLSSIFLYADELLLHVSRGVRWDSDHVVIMNDDVRHLAEEIVRGNVLDRVHVATDFFDASMNRVGAWVIGSRSTIKCFLAALLEPRKTLMSYEEGGDYFSRLALLEEMKTMPLGAVWDYYCLRSGVQVGVSYIDEIQQYERKVLRKREA